VEHGKIADTLAEYIALPDGAADAVTLWIAHAHAFKLFPCTPRLNIRSPEKRCGKSTCRDVIALLVPKPLLTENMTTAVLFRVIDRYQPTVLADEYDTWLRDNEELRGVLNAGHKLGGAAWRCVGDNYDVRGFNAFAPVVLVGIGALPSTLHDRSIVIRLAHAKHGEVKRRFDSQRTQAENELCRKLARWCADHAKQIRAADPLLPAGAFNRLADNWRPLFAIAEVVGGDWPQRAARAFALLTSQDDVDAHGIGTILLADVRTLFNEAATDRMFSKALVDSLVAMADEPWSEAHRGREINENWLAWIFGLCKSWQVIRRSP
jgi:hypothetical protein